jgi:hypothetical protein
MRCLNCQTVFLDTDKFCPACRTPVSAPGNQRPEQARPIIAMIFLVAGAVGYNFLFPPDAAAPTYGGINLQHAFTAGLVGGLCAVVGWVLDILWKLRKDRAGRAGYARSSNILQNRHP